jgi:hypothetical protein
MDQEELTVILDQVSGLCNELGRPESHVVSETAEQHRRVGFGFCIRRLEPIGVLKVNVDR